MATYRRRRAYDDAGVTDDVGGHDDGVIRINASRAYDDAGQGIRRRRWQWRATMLAGHMMMLAGI
jgi:hypothetical protein